MNLFDLTGRKAIVTGGTRGLGHGMAEGLMEAGAEVVIYGTSEKVLDVADEFSKRGFKCHGVSVNLGNPEDLEEAFKKSLDLLGGQIDILVNAAGIQRRHSSEEFPKKDWDDVLAINLTAPFLLSQLAAVEMKKRNKGKIINISSMLAFFGGQTVPAYAASKGGVTQFSKTMVNDLAKYGININCIAPGYMATEMNTALLDEENPRYEQILDRIPQGRWGTPDDMKGTVIFLASDASNYLNGAVIPVDGGYLIK